MVSASAPTPLTYQWRKNGSPITGQTNASFTINSASSADSGSYDVMVTGACGSATSQPATLTVNAFSLDKTSDSFPSSGGPGSINVSATVDICAWTATKEGGATWITLGASGGVGDGSGFLHATLASGTRNARMTAAFFID